MNSEKAHNEAERFLGLRSVKEVRTVKVSGEDFQLLVYRRDRGENLPGGSSGEIVNLLGGSIKSPLGGQPELIAAGIHERM